MSMAEGMDFSLERGTEVLRGTPEALRAMLANLSDDWTGGSEAPDAWTPWQVVGHLTHIEETDWIDRTMVILDHGTGRPFDPVDREAGFTRFKDWPLDHLLERFAEVRSSNLTELAALVSACIPRSARSRCASCWRRGSCTT
jgi:hypothetical protein